MKVLCLAAISLLVLVAPARAQVHPSATSTVSRVQVGGDYAMYNSDYFSGDHTFNQPAFTLFGDYRIRGSHRQLGIEINYHQLVDAAPGQRAERSLFVAPRFVYRTGRFEPFARVGIGMGHFNFASAIPGQNGNHLAASFGGGLDIHLHGRLVLRAVDFDQEHWSFTPHALSPSNVGIGLAFRLP
jgi:opacity protein-like surface antigen